MATRLHDLADPLQQCGDCAGWTRDQLWCRLEMIGDDHKGVTLQCEECGHTPLVLAYHGPCPPDGDLPRVYNLADLIAAGEQHVVQVHG